MSVSTQGTLLGGRYRVVRHIGSGGMASVLLCHDERLEREVAVKRLHADSPGDVEQRFAREAKLGASLNHPNLVTVFDTEVEDEGVLIVMEYVPGESLARALRHGQLGSRRVASMARELGAALDHAHAHGVVHRDVKPGNVLLRDDGVTKLVDLGIATASDGERLTRSGMVLGTAAYMAPEQLEGAEPVPAVDIYALAAVCFEALSGRRAREGKTPIEIAHAVAAGPPPDLGEAWPRAPRPAAEILRRGMARDPAERPASAGELGSALAEALEEEPSTAATRRLRKPAAAPAAAAPAAETARHAPVPAAAPRRAKRSNLPALIAAGLLVAIALATIAVALTSGGGDDPGADRAQSGGAAPPAENETREKPETSPDQGAGAAPAEESQPEQPAPAPGPEPEPAEEPAAAPDPARGAQLNAEGFDLMNAGRYDEAVPVLQQAVESFPAGSTSLDYAYALFNLGKSLRLSGRPDEAIPVLEQRLEIPNQTETVRAELDAARRAAGRA